MATDETMEFVIKSVVYFATIWQQYRLFDGTYTLPNINHGIQNSEHEIDN